jgi:hypothetical protein
VFSSIQLAPSSVLSLAEDDQPKEQIMKKRSMPWRSVSFFCAVLGLADPNSGLPSFAPTLGIGWEFTF